MRTIENTDSIPHQPENKTTQYYTMFIINGSGMVENWNQRAEKHLGYLESEVINKNCSLFIKENELVELLPKAIHTGHSTQEISIRLKGKPNWFKSIISLNPIFNKQQKISGFLVMLKHHEVNQELVSPPDYHSDFQKPANLIIQPQKEPVSKPLSNENRNLLKKELELIALFLSHDLKAPLRAIDSYLKLIEEDFFSELSEELINYIKQTQLNTKKINTYLENLLIISRIATRELNISNVNMNDLVEEVVADLKKEYPHPVKIKIGRLHTAAVDFSLIYQAMTQLISNAIKFSSLHSSPVIDITSEATDEFITYTVKDNGIGLDMQYANKLFHSKQKLHDNDAFEGSGMGLLITKRIIDKHHGKITVQSVLGEGSSFRVTIPLTHILNN